MADHRTLTRCRSGQAAMEFVLALFWIIALAALLYQALHFELDVFNKMNELRYRVFQAARQNQESTKGRTISDSVEGKPLGKIAPFPVPGQIVDTTLHYGPRRFYVHCGTKNWFPGGDFAQEFIRGAAIAGVWTDHAKIAPSWLGPLFDKTDAALSLLPCS